MSPSLPAPEPIQYQQTMNDDKRMSSTGTNTTVSTENDFMFSPEEEVAFESLTFPAHHFITKRHKHEEFKHHYALGSLVGTGGFGKVYKCIHMATGHERAAKILSKITSDRKKSSKVVKKEFEILTLLDHPNLVKVYEFFEDEESYYIVTDLYQGRDLFELLQTEGPLQEDQVAVILHRLLCCIQYCHQKNIVHRDLKLENILLNGDDYQNLKLIDFGLAKHLKTDKSFYEVVGSPSYLSPQMIEGEYHHGCDIWALGVVTYLLLCGEFPFGGSNDPKTIQNISTGQVAFTNQIFDTVTPECLDFVRQLFSMEEKDRPTAQAALQHPWLQKYTTNTAKPVLDQREIRGALQAMQQFQTRHCKLKFATGALIAAQFLRPHQRQTMDAVFRHLDQSCLGCLSIQDLRSAFAQYLELHGTVEELQELLLPMVTTEHGTAVQYSEFVAIVALEGPNAEQAFDLVEAVFRYLDADQKGYIGAEDLQARLLLSQDTPESSSRIMMAEVTSQAVLDQVAFERAILGTRTRHSAKTHLMKLLALRVDQCQAQAEAWTKNVGKMAQALMGK